MLRHVPKTTCLMFVLLNWVSMFLCTEYGYATFVTVTVTADQYDMASWTLDYTPDEIYLSTYALHSSRQSLSPVQKFQAE